jgi:hypothetical protein
MQTNLFSDDQLCKNDFIRSINIFSLEKALSILDKWRSAYSQLQNISEIEKSLIQLILDYEKAENKNEFLLALYTDNESAESYKGLVQYFRYVKEGLLYKLAELNPNADYYLKDGFHISEVYLKLEQYAAVEKSCELALKKFGEDSLLRQINAKAALKLNRSQEAMGLWTFAYFNQPADCKEEYLASAALNEKFRLLKEQKKNTKNAFIFFPFELWRSGNTHIFPRANDYKDILINHIKTTASTSVQEKTLHFNWRLYLAEAIRLDGGGKNRDRLIQLRTEMKQLIPGLFAKYLNKLKEFHHS